MTDSDHGRRTELPLDCTFEQLTAAVIGLLGDRAGTKSGMSRSSIHAIRAGERTLTKNAFGKIINGYVPEDRRTAWWERWERATLAPNHKKSPTPPRQLPSIVANFIGRNDQLKDLDERASICGDLDSPVIVAITGEPGVGKTALAVCWAHRISADFPDGQLYVNLRGYDPGEPLPVENALAGFLDALGLVWNPQASVDVLARSGQQADAGRAGQRFERRTCPTVAARYRR